MNIDDLVTIEIACLPEDIPVRGNCIVSGDDEYDCEVENTIIDRLNDGDQWAWCIVKVTVRLVDDFAISESVYLGGCSYDDEDDFLLGGYYEDMVSEAKENLKNRLENLKNLISEEI